MSRHSLRAAVLVTLAVAPAALAQPVYDGRVYTVEYVPGIGTPIVFNVMDLNGSNLAPLFTRTQLGSELNPAGLAVDENEDRVFFLHATAGASVITATQLDGAFIGAESAATYGAGLEADRDGHRLYFADAISAYIARIDYSLDPDSFFGIFQDTLSSTGAPAPDGPAGLVFYRYGRDLYQAFDDATGHQLVAGGAFPAAITLDPGNQHIYFVAADSGDIKRLNYDGTGLVTILPNPAPGFMTVGDLEIDLLNGRLYWLDNASNSILRSNLDGAGVVTIYTAEPGAVLSAFDVFAEYPACPADMDGQDLVNVFDLLMFLDFWFAFGDQTGPGLPGDYNADEVIDVFDLLAYLNDWFSPCP